MSDLNQSMQSMMNDLIQALPNVIGALLLLLLAWIVASISKAIIQKLLVKAKVGSALEKTPIAESKESADHTLRSVGKIVYYLVFILFIPAILNALNMDGVSEPITNMMDKILGFIPNLLAAGIILIVGYFVAKLVKEIVLKFLQSLKVDDWFNKVNPNKDDQSLEENQDSLANVLANILFIVILIPIITVALEALEISSVSDPIVMVLDQVLALVPNILVAIILLIAGYYIASLVSSLLTNLLNGTGINNIYSSFGIDEANKPNVDLAKIIGTTVKVLIILFFTVEAFNVLQLEVLNKIGSAIITYLPFLISALAILGIGLFVANLLANLMMKYSNSKLSATLVKYTVIVFAVFMTLDQLQFAPSIVNLAFMLILGSLAVAFAISFGIGGRDFAKKQLEKLDEKMNNKE
ncbi:mechanosensitive ion channel [Alkalibacillus almallahensis]|uniref:mechanosensitive ion channel n=1 Tax=Alkalibacillus almallahensis TaxID=1379154 RepID=UPI001422A4A8|nr:mechanosensitive ion channel [Alkalibacillus almallahensis]NIK12224.1 hypothetical protein [Alkalibacillus almallahensis]